MSDRHPRLLVEVSWEICNKVGGIHTALSTKAASTASAFGNAYYVIGPDLDTACAFEETDEPCWERIRKRVDARGIPCRFGRWDIPGRPKTILLRLPDRRKSSILFEMWEGFGIDSMTGGEDYVEPVLFGRAAGQVAEAIYRTTPEGDPSVACFHEWLSGAGLLYLKKHVPEMGTVFVAHATVLGRALSQAGADLYAVLEEIDPQAEARRLEAVAKHSLERACAKEADCFASVSALTGKEARRFLGKTPDVLVPNGMRLADIPDYAKDRTRPAESRSRLLDFASRFLGKDLPADTTRICLTSGRYEFRNKGMDILLESFGALNRRLKDEGSSTRLVAFIFAMAPHEGITREARARLQDGAPDAGVPGIATHAITDAQRDPVMKAAGSLALANAPDDPVQVIFFPSCLDGNDGLLNLSYYDALAGCDLGIFPSSYEPWGYTPLESLSYAVPAVTTDQTGFGRWALGATDRESAGLCVLSLFGRSAADSAGQLTGYLYDFLRWDDGRFASNRSAAREIAARADWELFHRNYLVAYDRAADAARGRLSESAGRETRLVYTGDPSSEPQLHPLDAVSSLPAELRRLRELASNLYWAWHPPIRSLFRRLDPRTWERCDGNPTAVLDTIRPERLEDACRDGECLDLYAESVAAFDEYMSDTTCRLDLPATISASRPIAFFSMEYGFHQSLPLYAGGLGVLAADYLKTASDMRFPIVGIGILFRKGYLSQRILPDGRQTSVDRDFDFSRLPIARMRDDGGRPLAIGIDLPGRTVTARLWRLQAGHVPVYLLDTDTRHNSPDDRSITHRLYDDNRMLRALQEILVGVGGVRALALLGIEPSIYHMNEGKTSFQILERIRRLTDVNGLDLPEAEEIVRASSTLTIHTTVAAGTERFGENVLSEPLRGYVEDTGIAWDAFWRLGQDEPGGTDSPFIMTVCGLKLAGITNAVSALHAGVTREIWKSVWGGFHPAEVPIISIRNGIHLPTWIGPEMRRLLDSHLGPDWAARSDSADTWRAAVKIPDEDIWNARTAQRQRMVDFLRKRFGCPLQADALTIVWARRFAPYKRPALILTDEERILRLLTDTDRPLQILIAGKAHPNDEVGGELLRRIVSFTRREGALGRMVFLPDFDLRTARYLTRGADVWLNTPVRLMEASGTSGQKSSINGGLNLSIPDGWWAEAFDGFNGWSIGEANGNGGASEDEADAASLYRILEETVLPMFYTRDERGVPTEWIRLVKNSLETIPPAYNSQRMVAEYVDAMYRPAAERTRHLSEDGFAAAKTLARWKRTVASRFSSARITRVEVSGMEDGVCKSGIDVVITASVELGELTPDEAAVEAIIFYAEGAQSTEQPVTVTLAATGQREGEAHLCRGTFRPPLSGHYSYGVRILPYNADLSYKQELGLVSWS